MAAQATLGDVVTGWNRRRGTRRTWTAGAPVLPHFVALALLLAAPAWAEVRFIIVGGLGGGPRYEKQFREQAASLAEAARKTAGDDSRVSLLSGPQATREAIVEAFLALESEAKPDDALAVILIGHGSWDFDAYKFNIPGPDLSDERLADLLDKAPPKRQLVVVATSSSGAALERLQKKGRIIVTATKNGRERNATVFAKYWVEALSTPEADTDKNEAITAEEAFRYAEAKVKAYFEVEKRLATEHARLEGKLAGSFTLAWLGSSVEAASDPELRPLYARREAIERKIEQLKLRKDEMIEDEYFDALQELLLDLARLQEEITKKTEPRP